MLEHCVVIYNICQLYRVYAHYMLDAAGNYAIDKLQFHRSFFPLYFLLLKVNPYNSILNQNQPTSQTTTKPNISILGHTQVLWACFRNIDTNFNLL